MRKEQAHCLSAWLLPSGRRWLLPVGWSIVADLCCFFFAAYMSYINPVYFAYAYTRVHLLP